MSDCSLCHGILTRRRLKSYGLYQKIGDAMRGDSRVRGVGVVRMGARNQTWVVWKNSHLSYPRVIILKQVRIKCRRWGMSEILKDMQSPGRLMTFSWCWGKLKYQGKWLSAPTNYKGIKWPKQRIECWSVWTVPMWLPWMSHVPRKQDTFQKIGQRLGGDREI